MTEVVTSVISARLLGYSIAFMWHCESVATALSVKELKIWHNGTLFSLSSHGLVVDCCVLTCFALHPSLNISTLLHLQAKTLTIGKLMEIAPQGTMDPTPFIYDSTMYTMAGLMVSTQLNCFRVRVGEKRKEVDS